MLKTAIELKLMENISASSSKYSNQQTNKTIETTP